MVAMDIVEFLTARLNEDEAGALATTPVPVAGRWRPARDKNNGPETPLALVQGREVPELDVLDEGDYVGTPIIAYSAEWQDEAEANLRFIARHDPARVLADVAAKREHLRMYVQQQGMLKSVHANPDKFTLDQQVAAAICAGVLEAVVRQDAGVYADHPDYNPSWRVPTTEENDHDR